MPAAPTTPTLLLPTLKTPRELERYSPDELNRLAAEIRQEICRLHDHRSVHFASNLGVVELTIALHSVFDFTHDRIIWDTGHQTYPHKLLTGRLEQFPTIRTKGGLSGFPDPEESEFDLLKTGHAGSSVGTILGLRCGDDLVAALNDQSPNDRHCVAVIGDGAFSSGGVYEAMNHAGGLKKNITVILNDNKMSICPRVGGLAEYFDNLRLHPRYSRFKQKLHNVVDRLPLIGGIVDSMFRRFKNMLKAVLIGGLFFNSLKFRYIGPIDGHNIPRLQRLLRLVRNLDEPVVLHVFTKKGRGYKPAEENPTEYHAPPAREFLNEPAEKWVLPDQSADCPENETAAGNTFNSTGLNGIAPNGLTFTEHARNTIDILMQENPKVCVITAAMCQGNMLEPVRDKYPDRFFDVGICESHAVVLASGLAKAGMIPVVDIYSTFLQRAYDQIFQEVSLQNLPIIFAIDRAGLVGPDGPTHHGVFDMAYLRPFPNLTVMVPADARELREMFQIAVRLSGPSAIRYPRMNAGDFSADGETVLFGKSSILRNTSGQADGMIAACGPFLETALGAADLLSEEGINAGVISVRFVKPLDTGMLLDPIRRGRFLITIEEGVLSGGFGSAILEVANEERLDTRYVYRLGIPDQYVEHGERRELLDILGLNAQRISELARLSALSRESG